MSGRSSAESIAERRLRHVYDNLDCGWNKKAIQEADKVLKKHPDTLGAKGLKALALVTLLSTPYRSQRSVRHSDVTRLANLHGGQAPISPLFIKAPPYDYRHPYKNFPHEGGAWPP